MIQLLHRLSQSWVASILMGMLALSFVVWGIGDVFTGSSESAVITVGNVKIGPDAFSSYYKHFLRHASQVSKTEITPDDARRQGLPLIAVQELVSRTVMTNIAASMGTAASEQAAATEIRGIKAFAGANGAFDHNVFLQTMQVADYSENEFIEEVRNDLTVQTLEKSVTDGFEAPSSYMLTLMAYIGERRAADYVLITPDMAGAVPTPSDSVLAAYVKAHPEKFSTPEYRDVSYAEISPQDLMGQIQITDAQIQQEYAARKASYVRPETRDLQQLEFPNEAAAKAARAKIDGGMSFDALLASEHKTAADVSLGTLAFTDFPDSARAKAAFALPVDGVSQPIKGPSGWVLMRVTKIAPGVTKTLADVRDAIRTELAAQLANSKMTDMANAFSDDRAAGDDIATAAKKTGMKSGRITAIDSNGLGPDGKSLAAASDPEFVAAIFKSDVGDDVDPFPTKAGAYYALKVNGTTPPKLKTLDAVRPEALAAWTSQQRDQMLVAKVRTLIAQAKKENALAGIAKSLGTKVQKSPGLDRGANDATFSPAITSSVFDAPPGGIVAGPGAESGDYIIAQVTGIAHPKPQGGAAYLQYASQRLSSQIAQDIPVALANAGRATQGVKINRKLLDTATGEGQ